MKSRIEKLFDILTKPDPIVTGPIKLRCGSCYNFFEQSNNGVFVWLKCKSCRVAGNKTMEQLYNAAYYKRNKKQIWEKRKKCLHA